MTVDLAKFDRIVSGIPEESEKIKNLLTQVETKEYNVLVIGDLKIKILPSLPKKLRKKVMDMSKIDDPDAQDEEAYNIIASMCVESPYNRSELWKALDEEYGLAIPVLDRIYKESVNTEASIRNFRGRG